MSIVSAVKICKQYLPIASASDGDRLATGASSLLEILWDTDCHVTIAVVRMRLAHVLSFGRESLSPSVLMCSVWFVGYSGGGCVFFFIFLSLSL